MDKYKEETKKTKIYLIDLNKRLLDEIKVCLVDIEDYLKYSHDFIYKEDYQPFGSLIARYNYHIKLEYIDLIDGVIEKFDLQFGKEAYNVMYGYNKNAGYTREHLSQIQDINAIISINFEFKGVPIK